MGDLKNKTVRIRAIGKVAWAIAFGSIAVAVLAALSVPATGGLSGPVATTSGFVMSGAAVGVLGVPVTYSAIAVAVAAGGVGSLNSLRKYKEVSRTKSSIVLKRK